MNTQFAAALRGATFHGDTKFLMAKSQQFTKLSEYLQACSDPDREQLIDDVIANADRLPVATLKRMSKALSAKAAAKEQSMSKKSLRLKRLQAAMDTQADDEETAKHVELARGELKRLGFNLNASGPDGFDVLELDNKMRELNWSDERILTLKSCCATIGLIEV